MHKFSQMSIEIQESDSYSLMKDDITKYISKVGKYMDPDVQKIIYLAEKYNLLTQEDMDTIRKCPANKLKDLADTWKADYADIKSMWDMFKRIKNKYKVLPQYLSGSELEAIQKGALTLDDLSMDLESSAGRNAVAKMSMPMVYHIVNQYVGRSRLDKSELISAGLEGLTYAMDHWRKNGKDSISWKTYMGNMVRNFILQDMNKNGHTLGGLDKGGYAAKQGGTLLDAVSFDNLPSDSDVDKLNALGEEDKPTDKEESMWEKVYKTLSNRFSARDMDIFYRFFGLNGHKKEKSKDIAKSYGMSEGNIRNSIINKIIKYIKNNNIISDILQEIQELYTESLMYDYMGMNRDTIIDNLIQDDTFILLEDLNRWEDKSSFMRSLDQALRTMDKKDHTGDNIRELLNGSFVNLDDNLKKEKEDIVWFLGEMYPNETFTNKTDVALLDYMSTVQKYCKKYKVKL